MRCLPIKTMKHMVGRNKSVPCVAFNPLDQQYQWRLKPLCDHLSVHLECHKGEKHFDATMAMKALPFNSRNLLMQLIKMPSQTVKVVFGIYWHALKLWLKGRPLFPS